MHLTATVRPTATTEIVASGPTLAEARAALEALVPAGHDLVQAHPKMSPGMVEVHGLVRPTATELIEAEAPSYPAALDQLRSRVPDGCALLAITITA